jgi:hypothetical protein
MCTYDNTMTDAPEGTAPEDAGERRGLLRQISDWVEACADYYAASAMYEELSRLSDAELKRRGLTRETLARDICAANDRTNTSR